MIHVNGIDVSDYQDPVSWPSVKESGYSFAYTKATEGTSEVQDSFAANMSGLERAEMLAGAYHFFHFDQDPEAQAKHFLSVYQPKTGDLPPMLDLEAQTNCSAAEAVERVSTWLHAVEAVTKKRCFLYMGFYYWRDSLGSTDGFTGHPLWLAQYSSDPAPDPTPHGWPVTMWQWSSTGTVGGISGNVDLDRFFGDIYALRAMTLEL